MKRSLYDTEFSIKNGIEDELAESTTYPGSQIDAGHGSDENEVCEFSSQFVLVIYDIGDNQRRLKLSKYLDGYGRRVQRSAYELKIPRRKLLKLLREIPGYCGNDDSIRLYHISRRSPVMSWGGCEGSDDVDDQNEKGDEMVIIV